MRTLLLLPPVAAALLGGATALLPSRALVRLSGLLASLVLLGTGIALLAARGAPVTLAGGLLRADALSAYLLALIGAVGLTATWGGLDPAPAGPLTGAQRRYGALVCVFLGAMSLAVITDNLGVLWIAVEATTITTAFLVGHRGTRRSLEAAWKYVILGSVGVAIALLGTVLLYAASRSAGEATLSWTALADGRIPLDPGLVKVATGLAILGFATKAGLAPMHSWLPDAHSQAPAPVSGLMSGVLLAVAFSAILRMQAIADSVLGVGFARGLLLTGGLASLLVAAALILRQRDYKRLLAYSSIEHMGLLAIGAAVGGPLALAAVLLHALGHGLAKATMFVVSGRMLAAEGSSRIADVRALLARRPAMAVPFVLGMGALLGLPPFALFFSETAIVLAGSRAGLGWAMGLTLALLLVVFAGLTRATLAMVLGPAPEPADPAADRGLEQGAGTERGVTADRGTGARRVAGTSAGVGPVLPLALALAATAVVGFLATPLGDAITRAVAVLR